MKKQFDNIKDYHAEQDKKHLQICEEKGITFEKLVELNMLRMKNSVQWAAWILQKNSMTKLDYFTATKIIECI